MTEQKYHPPVERLLSLGDPRDMGTEWPNYLKIGFSREHIPELLRVLKDSDLLTAMSDTLEVWAPVHAWRVLGQLHAFEAVDTLIGLLKQIDTTDDAWFLEELPDVFGLIGPQALPALTAYLGNKGHGVFSRSCAAGGIVKVGQVSPEHRLDCVGIIAAQLRRYDQDSAELNGFLVGDLLKLRASESIEVIREAFRARRVEIGIPGDLEEVEIELGLRKQRSTPQPRYNIFDGSRQTADKQEKVGRNDPCPCGSGKKYKKCCLQQQEASRSAQTAQQHAGGYDASYHLAESEIDRLSNRVPDLIKARRFDEAEAVCRELSSLYPDQIDGLERFVEVYKAKGDYDLVARYARQAIAFMKNRAEDYDSDLIAEMEEELRLSTSRLAGGKETLSEENSTSSLEAEADDWWKRYEAAAMPDRYDLLLATLRERISPEFLAQVELVEALLDLQGELVGNGYVAEAVRLIGQVHSHLPEVYRKSYEYFDELLVTWHLFQNDPTGVGEGLRRFKEDPIAGIDSLIPVLKKLCFFGFTDQALLLCEETFDAVNDAPDLIGDTEGELAHCIYLARLGWIYAQYKQGAAVDWESLARGMDRYEMEISPELLARTRANLTGGPLEGERLIGAFGLHREEELANLAFGFFRYMHDVRNMDFPCSELIWHHVAEFLSERKSSVKEATPDAFFRMTRAKLEPHLAGMIGDFLSRRQADAMAVLWGIPYIYDFLLDRRVISATTHRETIQIAAALKAEVIKGMGKRLWEFDFIHRWAPPGSVATSEFADEAAMFKQTCTPAVPLAEYGGTANRRLP